MAAYLAELDISTFDPKAPPPKTPAFWDIVDANRAPEDAELADILDKLGMPDATTLTRIAQPSRRRLRDVDQGPQEPARHPAPAREVRLRTGAQRHRRRRPVEAQWPAAGDLRQEQLAARSAAQSRPPATADAKQQ